jgi:hypothetical protein
MNTMAIVSELADSDFEAVGPYLFESYDAPPPEEDDDDQECRCCCCTGECRQQDDQYGDEALFAGFAEGDLS